MKSSPPDVVPLKTLKRKHNNLTADICRGDPIHGSDMLFTPGVCAQQVAKAARASPRGRPRPNRVGAPHGRGNRIARLHIPSRPDGAIIDGAYSASLFAPKQLAASISHLYGAIDNKNHDFSRCLRTPSKELPECSRQTWLIIKLSRFDFVNPRRMGVYIHIYGTLSAYFSPCSCYMGEPDRSDVASKEAPAWMRHYHLVGLRPRLPRIIKRL
jgi:hypothetical protein